MVVAVGIERRDRRSEGRALHRCTQVHRPYGTYVRLGQTAHNACEVSPAYGSFLFASAFESVKGVVEVVPLVPIEDAGPFHSVVIFWCSTNGSTAWLA